MRLIRALIGLLLLLAQGGWASDLAFIEVDQPFLGTGNGDIQVHRVTYSTFARSPWPGEAISYLQSPNCTVQAGGEYTYPDSSSRDQNVASRLGVRVVVEDRSDPSTWKEIGVTRKPSAHSPSSPIVGVDTLDVDVDLSRFPTALANLRGTNIGNEVTLDSLAEALVTCIRRNASRSKPPIKFVRIRFTGAAKARAHNGVYRVPVHE